MTRDDAVEFGQRFDLIDDNAAHLRGAVGGFLRQFENAAPQLVAGDFELALHLGGHLPHAGQRLLEAIGDLRKHLLRFAAMQGEHPVQQLAGVLALFFQRAGAFGARIGDDAGDLAGAAGCAVERLVQQAGEPL